MTKRQIINSAVIFLFILAARFFGPAIYHMLTEDKEIRDIRALLSGNWEKIGEKGYGNDLLYKKGHYYLGRYYRYEDGKLPQNYQVIPITISGHKEYYFQFVSLPIKILKLNKDTLIVAISTSVGSPMKYLDIYQRTNTDQRSSGSVKP